MKINIKHICIYSVMAATGLLTSSCNDFLEREPISNITPEQYFNTADELGNYAINYYTNLFRNDAGGYNVGPINGDADTDNLVSGDANTDRFAKGRWLVPASTNMDFSLIRAMNFFLERVLPKYEAGEISGSEADIKQYIGEIYFLRSMIYFDRMTAFGDFPIITEVLPDETGALIEASPRMPRNEVARFILEDLDKAIDLLQTGSAYKKVRISREVALVQKSKVALYEATFEKYHRGTPRVPGEPGWPGANMPYNQGKTFNIDGEIDFFLTEAMKAAAEVADNCPLTTNSKVWNPALNQVYGWNPYFEMFSMPDPSDLPEVLMWRQFNSTQSVTHGYIAYIREGGNNGMTKSYVDAFLMDNGLPIYAANSGYQGDTSIDQQKTSRDGRLQLFLFGETTAVTNSDSIRYFNPNVIGLTEHRDRTGFRIRKHYTYDPAQHESGITGTNGQIYYRSVDAYLNYIEASYLKNGVIDSKADSYWRQIRERAGIDPDYTKTIAATDLTKEPDWAIYSGSTVVDPTLYNIRRERRCEYIGEGARKNDLVRWRSYDALFPENMGTYIPEGVNFWTEMYKNESYEKTDSEGNPTGETALVEQADGVSSANISSRKDSKYIRPYRIIKENNEVWNGYQWAKAYYLNPISIRDLTLTSTDSQIENSVMYQNPYWPTVASASALE